MEENGLYDGNGRIMYSLLVATYGLSISIYFISEDQIISSLKLVKLYLLVSGYLDNKK
jgi:hypothetical protein